MSIDYTPTPTLAKFHKSDALVRVVCGPIGSSKTFSMIMELVRRMVEQEPWTDGIRRTRFAIVRNTLPQLKQTVAEDIKQILGPIAQFKIAESTFRFDFPLADGTRVQSDWLLLPLEHKEDQRRLLSLQLTGVWISECREVEYSVVAAALGRAGRYPSKALGGCTWYGLIAETNPWSEGSEWHEHMVLNRPDNWELFIQPGGLDPDAENLENLPPNYYQNLMEGHSEEWIKVHVHGKWGDDLSGQAVFRNSFNIDFHTTEGLKPNPLRPLLIGADWGRTPALILAQLDERGRLLIFEELLGEDIGIEQFITERLFPVLYERYTGMRAHIIGDPAGRMKSQVSEESVFDVIRRLGLTVSAAPTNDIAPRLRAVEKYLLRQVDGGAALLIDKAGCPTLIRSLARDYKYKRKKTGEVEDKPEKSHPFSDLCFTSGTMIMTPNGEVPIETLKVGDEVLTPKGPRRVVANSRRWADELLYLKFSNGREAVCTPDHPFMVNGEAVPAYTLSSTHVLEGIKWNKQSTVSAKTAEKSSPRTHGSLGKEKGNTVVGDAEQKVSAKQSALNTMGNGLRCITTGTTSINTLMKMGIAPLVPCTATYGSNSTGLFPMDTVSATRTIISVTILFKTLNWLRQKTMQGYIWSTVLKRENLTSKPGLKKHEKQPKSGINRKKDVHGTENMPSGHCKAASEKKEPSHALIAASSMKSMKNQGNEASVRLNANPLQEGQVELTTKNETAVSAMQNTNATGIQVEKHAVAIVRKNSLDAGDWVYNLTVEDTHVYYAEGVLVHNCDSLQYLCQGAETPAVGRVINPPPTRREQPPPVAAWT